MTGWGGRGEGTYVLSKPAIGGGEVVRGGDRETGEVTYEMAEGAI